MSCSLNSPISAKCWQGAFMRSVTAHCRVRCGVLHPPQSPTPASRTRVDIRHELKEICSHGSGSRNGNGDGVKRNGSRARSVTVAECIRPACAVNLIRAQHEAHGPTTAGVASEFRVILVSSQIVRLLQVSTSEHTSCTSSAYTSTLYQYKHDAWADS